MKPVKTQVVEVKRGHLTIEVYKDPSGKYRADYSGIGLAKVQPPGGSTPPMENLPGGRVPNCAGADEALAKAREEIERLYGKITRAHPPKVVA